MMQIKSTFLTLVGVATLVLGIAAWNVLTYAQDGGELKVDNSEATEKQKAATDSASKTDDTKASSQKLKTATFGGGCFWCVEAVFENMKGVADVVSGYEGGRLKNPNYKQVCTGRTGHAEVCEIKYDPSEVKFEELLEVFWKTHDPTTLNRQGADVGTQYRSVVFYHDDEQKELAEAYKAKLDKSGAFNRPIVTEISKASTFYPAEDYHQDFYANNPGHGYCAAVVRPKVEKFKQVFSEKVVDPK